jgi:hypothetical protein
MRLDEKNQLRQDLLVFIHEIFVLVPHARQFVEQPGSYVLSSGEQFELLFPYVGNVIRKILFNDVTALDVYDSDKYRLGNMEKIRVEICKGMF